MVATALPVSWDMSRWYAKAVVPAAADVQVVWRLTAQLRVWHEPSLLREMDPEKITSLDVSIAAGKGDRLAKEIYEFTGHMLGEACADFAAFSSPEAFIFFGGMTKAGNLIMDPIKRSYDEHVLKVFKGKAKFLVSGLDGASAAVLGASAIGWEL